MPLLPRPPHQLVLPLDGTVPPLCHDILGPTTRHRIQRGCQASPPLHPKNRRLSATGGTGCTSPPPPPSCPPSLATTARAAAPLSLCPPRAPTVGDRATQNTRGASRRPLCTRGTKTRQKHQPALVVRQPSIARAEQGSSSSAASVPRPPPRHRRGETTPTACSTGHACVTSCMPRDAPSTPPAKDCDQKHTKVEWTDKQLGCSSLTPTSSTPPCPSSPAAALPLPSLDVARTTPAAVPPSLKTFSVSPPSR